MFLPLRKGREKKNSESIAAYMKQYYDRNRGKINARNRKREAAKLQRTPPWLTQQHTDTMKDFYIMASDLGMEVDHIIPLQGKLVSGLHVPWNLQLLTGEDNRRKSNVF